MCFFFFFFFQAEDGIRDTSVTGVQTCALPIYCEHAAAGFRSPPGPAQPARRPRPGGLPKPAAACSQSAGYLRYCPTKSSTFCRSRRNTPPVPPHVPFSPNDVTPPITLLVPTKLGPPESPKQVPPVDALFESSSEKSPTMPPLI